MNGPAVGSSASSASSPSPGPGAPSAGESRDGSAAAPPGTVPFPRAPEDLEEALGRAIAGDHSGFVLLYRTLQPRLYRYAWALVGQDADDVTGEAWLQIARDLPSFFGDVDGFRGWAASITRHRALDLLKIRARHRAEPLDPHVWTQLADLTAAGDTAEVAITSLHTAHAVEMIALLPRDQAEAVLLRAVVGLSAQAAGAVLGKRAGAVRVAAHRGLKRLAAELARTPDGNGDGDGDGDD